MPNIFIGKRFTTFISSASSSSQKYILSILLNPVQILCTFVAKQQQHKQMLSLKLRNKQKVYYNYGFPNTR